MPKIIKIATALNLDSVQYDLEPIQGQSGPAPAVFRVPLMGTSVASQPELRAKVTSTDKASVLVLTGRMPVFRTENGVDVQVKKPIRMRFEFEYEAGTPSGDVENAIKLFWPAIYGDVLIAAAKTGTAIVN